MDNFAVRFAATPAGQWSLKKADVTLGYINEAVMWSMQGSHSLHWAMFLPMMMFVQWTRILVSAVLFVTFGKTVSKDDVQSIIKPTQEIIHEIQQRGMEKKEEKELSPEEAKLSDFAVYRFVTSYWFLRPLTKIVKMALYFFGMVPESALENEQNKEAEEKEQMENENNQQVGEQQQEENQHDHHQEHHEHHY